MYTLFTTFAINFIHMNCYYAIKLTPEQSISIFGLFHAKRTLSWNDFVDKKFLNLNTCLKNGVEGTKLYKIQPDIREWIKHQKVSIEDLPFLTEWKPNPFTDFQCCIGDIITYRRFITPEIIINAGITFEELHNKYGVDEETMVLFRYSLDNWIQLGMSESFIEKANFKAEHWSFLFGKLSKEDIIHKIKISKKYNEKLNS
jgi:hypothetical protein